MPTLVLSPRYTEDSQRLWQAAVTENVNQSVAGILRPRGASLHLTWRRYLALRGPYKMSERKRELALELGATHFINSSEEDPVPRVMEITAGGADVIATSK